MNLSKRAADLSGILLIILLSCTSILISDLECIRQIKFSPLIVGIIIGMIYANTLRHQVPVTWNPGIAFCSKQILRIGIVLYGFKITVGDVMDVGLAALIVDGLIVTITLGLGILLGKLLKMDKETTLLTSIGSSICGAAAILGAEPVVKGEAYKTAVAVSTVVIFGTISMFLYPFMYRTELLDMDTQQIGLYTGATLHEVAHVYGAGEAMDGEQESISDTCVIMSENCKKISKAICNHLRQYPENRDTIEPHLASMNQVCDELTSSLQTLPTFSPHTQPNIKRSAVIVKMVRVIMLAPVLIILAFILNRKRDTSESTGKVQVPLFAFFFLIVICFNSLGILPVRIVEGINTLDTFLLTMAMTALGVETSFDKFRKAGTKPFVLALLLFIWLIFGGYWLIKAVTKLLG